MITSCQVAVVGAGPYGLSAASHLRERNIETRIFGIPMQFWRENMPEGMLLRSPWRGSHISDARGRWTLDRFSQSGDAPSGFQRTARVPLWGFAHYGEWFRKSAVGEVDDRMVLQVERSGQGFRLRLEDGEEWQAERVVAATGLGLHTSRPPQFANVPSSLASHSSELRYPANFAGRRVAVIGAGQSAMESAVLLGEAGAEVELIARCPRLRWLRAVDGSQGNPWLRGVIHRATSPPSELGPFPLNWVVELPDMFRLVPGSYQLTVANRTVRPAASGWLLPRTGGLRLTTGRNVVSATHQSSGLVLKLDDGSERTVDHAVLATGYRIDVARYSYLSPLAPEVRSIDGYPVLSRGLESSVPRLHFTGAAAARSFGPLMRFVWGTGYASRELTCHLVSDTRVVAGMVRDYAGAIER